MARKRSIVEDLVARGATAGEAFQCLEFLVGYGLAEEKNGGPIRIEDYCESVGLGRAQGFRRLALWRVFFTSEGDSTPSRVWSSMPTHVKRSPFPLAVFLAATTVGVVSEQVDG